METVSTVGIDLSKNVFQICMRNSGGRILWNRKVSRAKFMDALSQVPSGTDVFMEACQGAHYWSRKIDKLGLKARQIAPQFVKPYVKSQKNDRADAEAISEAGRCGSMKFVPLKTVGQQELQALQRVRERLMHDRTALMNQMRGILAEHGMAINLGAPALKRAIAELYKEEDISPTIKTVVTDLREELAAIEERIEKYTGQLLVRGKQCPVVKRLCTVPGIGSLTAIALVTVSGDPKEFKNGRQFSAYLGLVCTLRKDL
jgi:transposase